MMCWSRSWPSGSRRKVRAAITERILREAKLDDQVAAAIAAIKTPDRRRAGKGHQGAVRAEAGS